MTPLNAISPLDGRYYDKVKIVSDYFSEFALIKKRVFVELQYLKALGKGDYLSLHEQFDEKAALEVKKFEAVTNHDVKAVEYYIRQKVPDKAKQWVHYALTSEDINNLAYGLMIRGFVKDVYLPSLTALINTLKDIAEENKGVAMLARTHGQAATPTTLGKELMVFVRRLEDQAVDLDEIEIKGKLNGATGNFNAHVIAEPTVDWIAFSKKFVTSLGLEPNMVTTQVEPKDSWIEIFHTVKRINNILIDMDRDIWLYIAFDIFLLRKKEGEVGSSTMPHKVNPIDFENSEGNLRIANALLTGFEDLQYSRLQRDLTDSTVIRNIGVAMGHSILAYDSTVKGLGKLIPNIDHMKKELDAHPEVLAEAIQTVLRKNGKTDAYEQLKELTRGKKMTLEQIRAFIGGLDIDKKDKDRLMKLTPGGYIGLAAELCDPDR